MQISDFLVKKCYSSITFCGFLRKKDTFGKEFPLSSMRNSKSCSVDVFNFLNMLQKSIFCYEISTAQKMKFSSKDFFSKCDQIRFFLQISSHLLKKPLIENFIFCAVLKLFYITFESYFFVFFT